MLVGYRGDFSIELFDVEALENVSLLAVESLLTCLGEFKTTRFAVS